MYLICRTRPDIAFAVGRLSKYNTDPHKGHLKVANRVVGYIKDIIYRELVYGQRLDGSSSTSPGPYSLVGYRDSNYAGDLEDKKSVIGYCFFLNNAIVLWSSKKYKIVLTLMTKVKYIAIGHIAREKVWIKRFINKLSLETTGLSQKSDNRANLNFTKNPESQYRTKHIDVQYHYI